VPVVRYELALDAVALDESLARSTRRAASRGSLGLGARPNFSAQPSARSQDSALTVSAQPSSSSSDAGSYGSDDEVDLPPGRPEGDAPETPGSRPREQYSLALENIAREAIDEGVARVARRALELGCALSGRRLSPEEMRALPQVYFDRAEAQRCAICLEGYQSQELLTALKCGHFFHVNCLAGWFSQTNKCPLCRTPCGG